MQKDYRLHYYLERSQLIHVRLSRKVADSLFRSLHDSICVAKRTLESGKVVPGGGAVDIALSIHLDNFCKSFNTKEQIAIS